MDQDKQESVHWQEEATRIYRERSLDSEGLEAYIVGDFLAASKKFLTKTMAGDNTASIDLAYMLRRAEIPTDIAVPPISQLLSASTREDGEFGQCNYALCLASGFQFAEDWTTADQLISQLVKPQEVLTWWWQLTWDDDPEGHLIVGWLVRHNLVADPEGLSISERMNRARRRFNVPAWMDEPATKSSD